MGGQLGHELHAGASVSGPTARPAGAETFDFLHGSWNVRHRRLVRRLADDDTWAEFGGTMTCRSIMAGLGNFDENVLDLPEGRYEACTLRMFEPASGDWSIRWIDGRDPAFDPPVRGGFVDGVGTFLGTDTCDGVAVDVRYLWSDATPSSARWEQAFSPDGGRTWETNWIMEFERA